METLLDLDQCESTTTTTFQKSMLYLRNRLTPSFSRGTILFPLSPHFSTGPQKYRTDASSSSVNKFIIGERTHRARSLTDQIRNNFLYTFPGHIDCYSQALRSRSYIIIQIYDIPSTQVIEMILDNPNQSTKANILNQIDSCSNSNSV